MIQRRRLRIWFRRARRRLAGMPWPGRSGTRSRSGSGATNLWRFLHPSPLGVLKLLVVVSMGLAGFLLASSSCSSRPSIREQTPWAMLPEARLDAEPEMRIRIMRKTQEVVIAPVSGSLVVSGSASSPSDRSRLTFGSAVRISLAGEAMAISPTRGGQAYRWPHPELSITAERGDLRVGSQAYPGTLRVRRNDSSLDVINDVKLETYLPGVLQRELYNHWHPTTFEAQAIAARSYAIVMAARSARRPWDMESTVASQAYIGRATLARAVEAVERTRGVVLVHQGRIVPAYYSSCAGQRGQDAAMIFPNERDMPPLRGRNHASIGPVSPHYSWGPITFNRDELARRLAAWGRQNRHEIANLSGLNGIEPDRNNSQGRPVSFRITDGRNRSFGLNAEQMRFAANFQASGSGLPNLSANQRLRSSDIQVSIEGTQVLIRGHGFGHGVGMSQHGAQHLAQRGLTAQAILGYYYPQAVLQRAY
ncbi:MAG: SpoIID/LytB domain-containing protein [Phycisphaeraceae bacterium]|nr:SpoIID/LytB domain-containing protein [Phycisphaeraceae bacterium]